ncbi:class I adenylate-forming enzyme family protein [Streptomyces sp. NBC_00091]|uniref:class I adenylate-forming enzyme family protein n=1 Tax=Streptomyces sp. NBC_00091 TaxID=2975648 RepID=UPI002253DE92|nr:class I adenylate-forming enzyme family protein [Streptomyces sp. NBC_00091]MCX5381173.1 acyl--CoA ligase [Streptomyces sp. NBC_00091]
MPALAHPEPPHFPHPSLDGLLRRAAERAPGAPAIRVGAQTLSFGELDARADRIAAFLECSVGRRGVRVGVANTLDADFAAAYYGTVRSGNTVVLLNPLVSPTRLVKVLASAEAELAFVPRNIAALLADADDRPPRLSLVLVTGAGDDPVPGDTVPLDLVLDAVAAATRCAAPGAPAAFDPDAEVCVQFTTGTTGRPKGVRLTHRNLVANAAQTAAVHRLDAGSVTLNHLPLYLPMHLNSAVYAGACQVLCPDPDPLASLALAERAGATHYYGLPARLHRLAADERLDRAGLPGIPAGPRLTAVLSGGSALSPDAARILGERLGVPVLQGYGLAELSPLTHSQSPDRPVPGSVGAPVPGTECRIVHPETGTPLDPAETGEVQVRGPQLMAGYLDESGPPAGPDGWFSTGDVGRIGPDGELFLVDRLGDVFLHDGELVSPSAVERVLGSDPRVAECAVVGWPDAVHGAVTWAGIVLRDRGAAPAVLEEIAARANTRLAPFEHIRRVEAIDAVPRTPVGKPVRGELRRTVRTRAAAEAAA